jgi:hypothetical protein
VAGKVLYWLAVLIVSLALLVALVLFFISRDTSQLGSGGLLLLWRRQLRLTFVGPRRM